MAWPQSVRVEALVKSRRSCCICKKFCGGKIELHHIIAESEGGESTLDNCIPLCFDCHADVGHYNTEHPRGTKYSTQELRSQRDNWFSKVDRTDSGSNDHRLLEIDQRIATEIHGLMMKGGGYQFLKEHDLWVAHHADETASLFALGYMIRQVDFEFWDADLENLRAAFAEKLNKACGEVARLTAPCSGNFELRKVCSDLELMRLPEDRMEEVRAEVQRGNDLCTDAADAYDDLYRGFRQKLGLDLRIERLPARTLPDELIVVDGRS